MLNQPYLDIQANVQHMSVLHLVLIIWQKLLSKAICQEHTPGAMWAAKNIM